MASPVAWIGKYEEFWKRFRTGSKRKTTIVPLLLRHPPSSTIAPAKPRLTGQAPCLPATALLVALLLFALPLRAQTDCLACHGDKTMKDAAGHSIGLDAAVFHGSVHGSLKCTDCHSDIKGYPHPQHPAAVQCLTCHAQEATGVAGSVHAQASEHPCLSCHGNPHVIVPATDPHSPVYPLNIPKTCGECHGNAALSKQHHLKNVYSEYVDSIHGSAVTRDGLLVAANCSSCHGTHHILSHTNPESPTYRANIPNTCGKCHAGVEAQYMAGAHGKALLAGSQKAPVCTDCHTAHRIEGPQGAKFQEATVGTCGGCHKERYATYRDTFHAQVSALGYVEVAHCWDCHGAHEVLASYDPHSPTNRANLVHTCGQCHKQANLSFVSYDPHANPYSLKNNTALFLIRVFMNLLLWGVLGFFALHTLLWLVRSQWEQWKQRRPEEKDHE